MNGSTFLGLILTLVFGVQTEALSLAVDATVNASIDTTISYPPVGKPECFKDSQCPTIYCIKAPCPQNVCRNGQCVPQIDLITASPVKDTKSYPTPSKPIPVPTKDLPPVVTYPIGKPVSVPTSPVTAPTKYLPPVAENPIGKPISVPPKPVTVPTKDVPPVVSVPFCKPVEVPTKPVTVPTNYLPPVTVIPPVPAPVKDPSTDECKQDSDCPFIACKGITPCPKYGCKKNTCVFNDATSAPTSKPVRPPRKPSTRKPSAPTRGHECLKDSDCPVIMCIRAPCPQFVCNKNQCVPAPIIDPMVPTQPKPTAPAPIKPAPTEPAPSKYVPISPVAVPPPVIQIKQCYKDSECPVINCIQFPCPFYVCLSGKCIIKDPIPVPPPAIKAYPIPSYPISTVPKWPVPPIQISASTDISN